MVTKKPINWSIGIVIILHDDDTIEIEVHSTVNKDRLCVWFKAINDPQFRFRTLPYLMDKKDAVTWLHQNVECLMRNRDTERFKNAIREAVLREYQKHQPKPKQAALKSLKEVAEAA